MPISESAADTSRVPDPRFMRWLWIVPLLLTAAVYAPAYWAELVWDDLLIVDQQLPKFVSLADAMKPSLEVAASMGRYYRPVVFLSLMLDRAIFGANSAFGFHLSNVLYHVATTFFVWLLARRLLRHLPYGAVGALVAATVFGVHPIHVESVSWISGRTDVIASMLLIPSILLALHWRDKQAWWALGLGATLFLLALLAKEVVIAGLVIIPAALILVARETEDSGGAQVQSTVNPWVWLGLAMAYIATLCIYFALRIEAQSVEISVLPMNWTAQFELLIRSTAFYFYKALIPWPQYSTVIAAMLPGLIVSVVLLSAGAALGIAGVVRRRRSGEGLLLFAVLWFGAAIAPSLLIAINGYTTTPVAERYLYLPTVAVALLLGAVVCRALLWPKLKPAVWVIAALTMAYAASTVERSIVWQTSLNLWTDATEKSPDLAFPWHQLGAIYARQGDMDKALELYFRSLEGRDDSVTHAWSHSNIGTIYLQTGRLQDAETHFLASLSGWPRRQEAHWNLGNLYGQMMIRVPEGAGAAAERVKYFNKAVGYYQSALEYGPAVQSLRWELIVLFANSGAILQAQGDSAGAARQYRIARTQIDEMIAQYPAAADRQEVRATRDQLEIRLSN